METPNEQNPGPSFITIVIGLAILVVIGAGFLYAANRFDVWPYGENSLKPSNGTTQVYTSSDYGYQVTYPSSWHHEECRDAGPGGTYLLTSFGSEEDLVVCNSDAPILGIVNITATPGSISEMEIAGTFGAVNNATRTDVTIDGNPAIRVEGLTKELEPGAPSQTPAGLKYVAIWSAKGTSLYRFIFIGAAENLPQFDQVVSTFKFAK